MLEEDIFKGATRPPMLWGVPMVPMVALSLVTLLLVIWGGTFVSGWVAAAVVMTAIPAFMWMKMVSKKDDHRLNQMFIRLKLALLNKNRKFWKARSYVPIQYVGTEAKYFK